jgi:hypothetical protein
MPTFTAVPDPTDAEWERFAAVPAGEQRVLRPLPTGGSGFRTGADRGSEAVGGRHRAGETP